MNFGVLEVATSNSKATAPGWAYVPVAPVTASHPASRKRVRNELPSTQRETTAKQDAKILRELSALDRENHKDVAIPVPVHHRDNAGRVSHGKVTPGVRKILQSQKTFANHLDDFEALPPSEKNININTIRSTPSTLVTNSTKRSHKRKKLGTSLRKISSFSKTKSEDEPITDASNLSLGDAPDPPAHPRDNDVLLVSRIPALPSQEEIDRLIAAPPLSYNEARGMLTAEDRRKPVRKFCEVCGYWGRVKCTRCGGRVCALECLTVHQEECFTRYGA